MGEKRKISLVLADVDGTLVTQQKVLTQHAQAAVQALRRTGVRFAITSGRPPRGMAMLFDALALETPISGFNGGLFAAGATAIVAGSAIFGRSDYKSAITAIRASAVAAEVEP
jgi:HAD superfamily hydrolase (TIGR01484 family)